MHTKLKAGWVAFFWYSLYEKCSDVLRQTAWNARVMYSAWNSKDNYDTRASVFVVNITETTYSCQFQYVFGNQ